jgi:hypothetical protein
MKLRSLNKQVCCLTFLAMLLDSQSRPSYKPSPEVAHVLWIYQWRWRNEWRPSLSVISAAFIALGRSCLLANTSRTASRSSSCKGPANPKCYILNTESNGLTKQTSLGDGLDNGTRGLATKISKIPVTWFQLLSPKRSQSLQ